MSTVKELPYREAKMLLETAPIRMVPAPIDHPLLSCPSYCEPEIQVDGVWLGLAETTLVDDIATGYPMPVVPKAPKDYYTEAHARRYYLKGLNRMREGARIKNHGKGRRTFAVIAQVSDG